MKTILLPVKDFKLAKARLSPALEPGQRAALAEAMYTGVLHALSKAKRPDRIVVFTASERASEIARPFGFDIVDEESLMGHSGAVNLMMDRLAGSVSMIFSLAADLPRLAPADIDFVFSTVRKPLAIIPSRDGTGTNGLVVTPPARIMAEYGEGSFRRHLSKAQAAGIGMEILNVPGIAFDLDTPEDLRLFMSDPPDDSAAWRYLRGLRL